MIKLIIKIPIEFIKSVKINQEAMPAKLINNTLN